MPSKTKQMSESGGSVVLEVVHHPGDTLVCPIDEVDHCGHGQELEPPRGRPVFESLCPARWTHAVGGHFIGIEFPVARLTPGHAAPSRQRQAAQPSSTLAAAAVRTLGAHPDLDRRRPELEAFPEAPLHVAQIGLL